MRSLSTLAFALVVAAFAANAQDAPQAAQPAAERKDPRDQDGDHRASWEEYRKAMSDNFTRLDKNADGVLEAAEMPQPPANPDQKLSRAQFDSGLRASFDQLDKDKDGFLAGDEFPEADRK